MVASVDTGGVTSQGSSTRPPSTAYTTERGPGGEGEGRGPLLVTDWGRVECSVIVLVR